MNCIIFSKDRACQLDLLLRSIKKYFSEWQSCSFQVLHRATSEIFKEGYSRVKQKHPEFNYLEEQVFRTDLIKILNSAKFDSLMFLMDDNIFIKEFRPNKYLKNKEVICHSLRLCPTLDSCYMVGQKMKLPVFVPDLTWEWRKGELDWGYPMSFDAHIFRTYQIATWLKSLMWRSPNTAEAALDGFARGDESLPPKMSCFLEAKIVNIVSNRVNVDAPNRIPNNPTDVAKLNEEFLSGKQIKLPDIKNHNDCHIEYNYEYE